MRQQTRTYLEELIRDHGPFAKVLDVGSLDVSGSVRDLFTNSVYTGLDMRDGVNVDIVANAHDLQTVFPEEKFDLVICADTLEHYDKFWETVEGLRYVTKPGGWLFIGVPSRRCPEHDHPHDYWRFMPQCMTEFLVGFKEFKTIVDREEATSDMEDEVYGWGRKPE